ncbi:MAG: HNH endonuclease [Sphingomonadales bacterium]|nr:HNH endonuclease [Sphingomonadales bacterium]
MAEKEPDSPAAACWLCARPLGRRRELHHPVPRSRGGRTTVAVHPVCHRAIHAAFSNAELVRLPADPVLLRSRAELKGFLAWIAGKPPDFHVSTAPRRGRGR